jgi:hypothetical protein
LDPKLMEKALKAYIAVLLELTPEQIVQAFSPAETCSKYYLVPATLREYSGRPATGDPIAAEAREELFRIVTAMRGKHAPQLRGPSWASDVRNRGGATHPRRE